MHTAKSDLVALMGRARAWARGASLVVSSIALFGVASACSSSDPGPVGSTVEDGGTDGSAPVAPTDGASPNEPTDGAANGPAPLKIQLDYRFDKAGFFADPVRKRALEAACTVWGRALAGEFPNVPAGTSILTRDPQGPARAGTTFDIDYEIDDLLVFVGSADLAAGTLGTSSPTAGLANVKDGALRSSLGARFDGAKFQPWTAWISFDSGTSFHFDPAPEAGGQVPAGQIDFVSVALHELGHVLGFGTAKAFESRVEGSSFGGARAKAVFGGLVPLAQDLRHFPRSLVFEGKSALMDVSDSAGVRYYPTKLDVAVFEDLGYVAR